jgi:hypothetical protein
MAEARRLSAPPCWGLMAAVLSSTTSGCVWSGHAARQGLIAGPQPSADIVNSTLRPDPDRVPPGRTIPPPALGVDL